ncbi:hypothetical protein [Burkholderia sp. A2]|uniref:hypothetical protein n=1 Tax=Burkholderia sp. A2 TaxID=236253 RepID=UPI00159F1CFB|nr:hypothetical protein [Burkholderia sp. A2]
MKKKELIGRLMRRRSVKKRDRDMETEKREGPRRIGSCRRSGFNSPVRAGPGNPDPALRAADLVSAVRRSSSVLHYVCSQVHCIFFLAASGHYPLNSGEVKRLRLHPSRYTGDSATVFPNAYGNCDAVSAMLHSLRRSF